MGRARQPIAVIEAKGKKHLTKAEIAEREATEVKVLSTDVVPPDYLPKKFHEEFNHIAKILVESRILTELDTDALANYFLSRENYLKINKEIMKGKMDLDELDKQSRVANRYFNQMLAGAKELGLTVMSRAKLVVPEQPKTEKKNKFEDFE